MVNEEEILEEIVRISNLDKVPDDPRAVDMDKFGNISTGAVTSKFDSWTKAKKAAGIKNVRGSNETYDDLTCAECNKEKSMPKSTYINTRGDWLCSDECKNLYYNYSTNCDYCGSGFERHRSQIERYENTYCSVSCKRKDERTSKDHRRELQIWADKIKKENNYICEECGDSYEVMCAHHHPPRSKISSKEEELNLDNGICLCYPCHAKKHKGTNKEDLILSWWDWYKSNNNDSSF